MNIDALNVNFGYVDTTDMLCSNYEPKNIKIPKVYISNISSSKLTNTVDDTSVLKEFGCKNKTFDHFIAYILENQAVVRRTDESRTDTFTSYASR
ncbi:unnamed protein product [Cunninghamella echinulata]